MILPANNGIEWLLIIGNFIFVNLMCVTIIIRGTDVAVSSEHGGAIYQQNILKACYGGSVTEDLIRDIDAAIKNVPPGELAYLRYRQLGVFNARGGNPEYGMDRIHERIASFAHAPAPLRFNAVPLWHHLGYDQTRQAWLRQAIQDYINEHAPNIEQINHEVEQNRAQSYLNHQTIYSFSSNIEQNNPYVVWNGCPVVRDGHYFLYAPHCTIPGPTLSLKNGDLVPVFASCLGISYQAQRDITSGYTRIVAFNEKSYPIHHSPYVRTGCSTSPFFGIIWGKAHDLHTKMFRTVCIDCLPIYEQKPAQYGMTHTFLNCVCPTF
jgi:hypothetical protein